MNFDGLFAMTESEKEKVLDNAWVEKVCPKLAMGVGRIQNWVKELLKIENKD